MVAIPGLASWDCVRELAAACALSLAAAAPSRIPAAIVIGGAFALGARYLGNPAVLVGTAFADLADGKIASIGALLAAQTAGLVLGRAIAGLFHGGPTPAQPPT